MTIWITGLPGSGKSTLSEALDAAIRSLGGHTIRLDGDVLRSSYDAPLGFSEADRHEQTARACRQALEGCEAGSLVLVSLISPFAQDRQEARRAHEARGFKFFEIYLSTPASVCEARDPKGLWKRARQGEISDFTGVSSPYEPPEICDLVLDTDALDLAECTRAVVETAGLLVPIG